jgi:hypothetical protein
MIMAKDIMMMMMRKPRLSKLEIVLITSCTEYGDLKQTFPQLSYLSIRRGRKGRTYEPFVFPFFLTRNQYYPSSIVSD